MSHCSKVMGSQRDYEFVWAEILACLLEQEKIRSTYNKNCHR